VYLKTLSLTCFKNYTASKFEFSPALNFLTGENGSGKTNVLDGIHYLCLGKSYFHATDQQAVNHSGSYFRMEGLFINEREPVRIVCSYASGGKKEVSKNGSPYGRLTDHVGLIPVVMIAPDDHTLIDEGSDERRRFIDNTISQIDHLYLEDLVAYNKVLQQRNATLKHFAARRIFDGTLIEILNDQLASFGKKIFEKRETYLKMMVPLMEKYYAIICDQKESITAKYDSVFHRDELLIALKNSLEKDRQLERTTEGIHRDEFEFCLNNLPVKKFGSQGQKKSFLMALKLAQWELIKTEKDTTPILLLDDLFDKLDEIRSHHILNLIAEDSFGQVFITDTNATRIGNMVSGNSKEAKHFEIREGTVG
jgi:DNA replication and repair protein RecF